jgi:NAD(P)-dependent dehydrogenase (short-subunit alcohol dehydrogenase family)
VSTPLDTPKRILVTGSTTGIGLATIEMLLEAGHHVVAHARNEERVATVESLTPDVVVGDLESLSETKAIAAAVGELGPLDAVIHNAGVYGSGGRVETRDGVERTFQVNVLAPYVLTALIAMPSRLIYVASGMASEGEIALEDLQRLRRRWSSTAAYSDSKMCILGLALGIARRYPDTVTTAICPGWVRTRMGGAGAPTDVHTGAATQVWLAASDDPAALRTGRYMRHMNDLEFPRAASVESTQDGLLDACARLSGVELPVNT